MRKNNRNARMVGWVILGTVFAISNRQICIAAEKTGILEKAVSVDEAGNLSYIPNDFIEENLMQEISFFQDAILSSCYTYDMEINKDRLSLRLISLDSGELLYEKEMQVENSYAVTIQVCGEQIVVSDAQAGKIFVLDENLNETKTYEIHGDNIYVNATLTEAYCLTYSDGIHKVNLETGEEQILLENTSGLYAYSFEKDNLSLRFTDLSGSGKKECYAGLNMETGELELWEIEESFQSFEYVDGTWAGELISENSSYVIGTKKEPYQFSTEFSYPTMQYNGDSEQLLFMTTDLKGIQEMYAYASDGTFLSSFSMENLKGTLTMRLLWSETENGYYLLLIDDTGHDQLYFWDFSNSAEGENLTLISSYEEELVGGEILEQTYYERAETLSETYGVTIKIADQCQTEYNDKYAMQECDVTKVSTGLDVLEKAFSSYPEGFFQQLYYGIYRKIEIDLMGTISNKEDIEGYAPTAFVQQSDGKITMVLNINESAEILEQNFYHESSHIIDKVLENDAFYREDALYAEETWWSFNPAEFIELNPAYGGYFESYEMMPMEYYEELFTSCFVIDYGKTFSTEDRATIFEQAMLGAAQIFSNERFPVVFSKLEYYCQCIRDCFDTTGWPEYTKWEATLNNAR